MSHCCHEDNNIAITLTVRMMSRCSLPTCLAAGVKHLHTSLLKPPLMGLKYLLDITKRETEGGGAVPTTSGIL